MTGQQVDSLQAAVCARDEVLATVAHDLRTPISTVIMATGMLEDMNLDAAQHHHFLEIIRRSAGQINKLIEDLVDVSNIEAGGLNLDLVVQPIGPILDEIREAFEHRARQAGLLFDCESGQAYGCEIPADRVRLVQLLENLVGNAFKFTPVGGRVSVRAEAIGASIVIAVIDTGVGISKEALPHVFERFWQAGHQHRAGAGLGLAIAKGIVEAHGGRIGVDSTPGSGTIFFFNLPRA